MILGTRDFALMPISDAHSRLYDSRVKRLTLSASAVIIAVACNSGSVPTTATPSSLVVASPTSTPRPGSEGSTCGRLVDYASANPADLFLTLEIRQADQSTKIWRYHLTGRGSAPSDLGTQFAAGTVQIVYISGWFAPVSPSASEV